MKRALCLSALIFLAIAMHAIEPLTVRAPGSSELILKVWLSEKNQKLTYQVNRSGKILISDSEVGIRTETKNYREGLNLVRSDRRIIDKFYTLPTGKRSKYHNNARELTLHLQKDRESFKAQFRVYDEGIAFRLVFPEPVNVLKEYSDFEMGKIDKGFGQEYVYVNRFGVKDRQNNESMQKVRDYEQMVDDPWYMPLLLKLEGQRGWAWISEAMLAGVEGPAYSACHLKCDENGSLSVAFDEDHGPDSPIEGINKTPWRTVILGKNLDRIVESAIIENLAAPFQENDYSWVKTGRVAWPWLTDTWGNSTLEGIKTYVDLARDAGWEYACLDLGWYENDYPWVREAIDYANSQDVEMILWYDHNRLSSKRKIEQEFEKIRRWGVAGVKIDFVYDDHQDMQTYIVELLRIASRHHLLVNFHGISKPVGYRRTWPNQISREAVKAHEWYRNNASPPERHKFAPSSEHYCIIPFNRNVAGPMDVTPVMMDPRARKFITSAFDIALPVIFECGLQHYGSKHSKIRNSSAYPFLKACPASWDETKLVGGYPGKYVIMARRKGKEWFIGGITVKSRTFNFEFNFLKPGWQYQMEIYYDGKERNDIEVKHLSVENGEKISVDAKQDGGFAAHIKIKKQNN